MTALTDKSIARLAVSNLIRGVVITVGLSVLPFSVGAQTSQNARPAMEMGKGASGDAGMKLHKPMADMQKKMGAMKMTGNADIDFAMMMVSHHQAAIDMAQVEVDGGKDPLMIKMAKKIIVDQKKEIAQFEAWLKKNPHAMK